MSQGIRGANWVHNQKPEERKSAFKALARARMREKELRKTHKVYYEKTSSNPPTWVMKVVSKDK